MVYADYDYYLNEYSGNAVAEADFARLSRQASAYLDSLTCGKIRGTWVDDSRVKDASCALADILHAQEQGGEVASESNDGASVTYVTGSATPEQRMYNAAAMYLSGTGLLYAGVL